MDLYYIIFFILGYAVGKTPFVMQWLKIRSENLELKKDIIVLKEHLTRNGRGRVVRRAVQDESKVQDAVQDEVQDES